MKELVIEKIQKSEIKEVTGILTKAFKENPAYSTIFKKKDQLEDGLTWLFRTNLFMLNQNQAVTNVIKEKNTGKTIGTFTILPPQGVKKSLLTYCKIGIPGFLTRFGAEPLVRMISLDHYNKKLLSQSIKTSGYYYLHMVAIREEYRGSGIGTFALSGAIRELIGSKPNFRLLGLTTQLPENVVFYSRLGFQKLDEDCIDFKGDKYYNCTMKLNLEKVAT